MMKQDIHFRTLSRGPRIDWARARGERYFSGKVVSLAEAYPQPPRDEGDRGETEA